MDLIIEAIKHLGSTWLLSSVEISKDKNLS